MDVREKLVELLAGCPCESDCEGMIGSCPNRKNGNCNEIFKLSYCAVSKLAKHLIANGVTVQEWIPVTERLPNHWEDVLVRLQCGDCVVAVRSGLIWRVRWNNTLLDREPTHWMPLPQPPKGE